MEIQQDCSVDLKWSCAAPESSLVYWSQRIVSLDLGNILRQKVTNLRTGRLIFEGAELARFEFH